MNAPTIVWIAFCAFAVALALIEPLKDAINDWIDWLIEDEER